MIIQSRAAKAAVLASGSVLTALVGVITVAVLARVLDVREYATYRQALLIVGLIAPLLSLGVPEALYYLLPVAEDRARQVALEALVVLATAGALFLLFLLLGGDSIVSILVSSPETSERLALGGLLIAIWLPSAAVAPCLVALGRVQLAAGYNALSRLAILLAVIAAAIIWRTAVAALLAYAASSGVALVAGVSLMLRQCRGAWRVHWRGLAAIVKYAVPIGIVGMVGATAASVDKVIVSARCSPAEFATYVNGAMEVPLVAVLTSSVMAVLLPDMAKLVSANRRLDALALWQRASTKTALGIFPVFWALQYLANDFISLLYSPRYGDSVSVFRLYLGLLPLRIVFFGAALIAAGRTKILLLTSTLGLVTAATLAFPFVDAVGPPGAAAASLVSLYAIQIPLTLHFIANVYGIRWWGVLPYRSLTTVAVSAGAASIVMLPRVLGWRFEAYAANLLVYGGLYAIILGGVFAAVGLVDPRMLIVRARATCDRLRAT